MYKNTDKILDRPFYRKNFLLLIEKLIIQKYFVDSCGKSGDFRIQGLSLFEYIFFLKNKTWP